MTLQERKAMELALELLAVATFHSPELQAKRTEVVEQGLEALAQPEQELVGTVKELFTQAAWERLDLRGSTKVYIATPQQELVCICGAVWEGQELVSTPPQRTWVGLTDKERLEMWKNYNPLHGMSEFMRQIEAKLKEKNT